MLPSLNGEERPHTGPASSDPCLDRLGGGLVVAHAGCAIRTYGQRHVPALLQTAACARAQIQSACPKATSATVEHLVAARLSQQQRIFDPAGPVLWAVVDQTALRALADPSIQRAQLRYLSQLAELPNVIVQAIPGRRGETPACTELGFTLLRTPAPEPVELVWLDQHIPARFLHSPARISHYQKTMYRLAIRALSPANTLDLLARTTWAPATRADGRAW